MYKISAAITLAALLAIGAFGQTPGPYATVRAHIRIEGGEVHGTFGSFEASVLAGLDRQVIDQENILIALRAKYNEDYPDVQTAKLNLAILQAGRDKVARTNADIANMRVAALLDPGMLTRGTGDSSNRAVQPAAHETLFVIGAPARGGSNILQATEASSNGKPLFSRPAAELSLDAVAAYEK